MDLKSIYREIVNEHNLHPQYKKELAHPTYCMQGANPTCGDDITLNMNVDDDGVIKEVSFTGSGCAVSQASTDIMLELIEGKTKDEALDFVQAFMRMVKGEASDEDIEMLEDAAALADVAHMPARVKCATLAWHTLEKILSGENE